MNLLKESDDEPSSSILRGADILFLDVLGLVLIAHSPRAVLPYFATAALLLQLTFVPSLLAFIRRGRGTLQGKGLLNAPLRLKVTQLLRRLASCDRRLGAALSHRVPSLLLGYGYRLEPRHTRRLIPLLEQGIKCGAAGRHGSFTLHNLELRNHQPLFMPQHELRGMICLFGTTGAGKTRMLSFLVAQQILRNVNLVIIDPKGDGELKAQIEQLCRLCGRERDFYTLDTEDERCCSVHLNPLKAVGRDNEAGSRLCALMNGQGSSEQFRQYVHMAVSAAAAVLRLNGRTLTLRRLQELLLSPHQLALGLREYVESSGRRYLADSELESWLKRLFPERHLGSVALFELFFADLQKCGAPPADPAVPLILGVASYPEEYFRKVTAGVMPVLNALIGGHLSAVLSDEKEGVSLDALLERGCVLHVGLHALIDQQSAHHLGRLLLSELAAGAGRVYAQGHSRQVCVVVDEASELICPPLTQLLGKARGAGYGLIVATQTLADLSEGGGEAVAMKIVGNCNTLISLRVKDEYTAGLITRAMPSTAVYHHSHSHSVAAGDEDNLRRASGIGRSREERELLPPQLLTTLLDGEFVASLPDGRLVTGRTPLLEDRDDPQDVRELLRSLTAQAA
ncbi:MAG: type IV secretion system DNA-binding domain-containing protein [Succinivibrio sp.]|nr:type IV secretion system DNA-binding domain-containing protein [Succinivibrio sp.]